MKDNYKTIKTPTEGLLFKDRGSKFYGNAYPIKTSHEVVEIIEKLKKTHPKAGHHCYAWKLGVTDNNYRANDDGEPSHSAGDPILGQINSYEVTNILVVVSRIFGGTKLGVGGLIHAYRETAKLVLENAGIITKTITESVLITFDYPQMSQVMRLIDDNNYVIEKQDLTSTCKIQIGVPASGVHTVLKKLNQMYPIKAKAVKTKD